MVNHPRNQEPLTLFEYSVMKVRSLGRMGETHRHKSWASLIFNYEDSTIRDYLMSIVKREYKPYFSEDALEYKFLEDKIRKNFPQFYNAAKKDLFTTIDEGLEAELEEQQSSRSRESYEVSSLSHISKVDDTHVYKVGLELEEGSDPHFSEGSPVGFRSFGQLYRCEVVEFDYVNAELFISSKSALQLSDYTRIISDASFNTSELKKLLQEIKQEGIDPTKPLMKFINGTTKKLRSIPHGGYPDYIDALLEKDASQREAFHASLNNDITFIWGPPGTGKSYTLAAIIMALHHMTQERTAVCCLSNVAVDQLLNKVVHIIKTYEPDTKQGEFYRAGRTLDSELIATDFLYPDDSTSQMLRLKIKAKNLKIEHYKKERQQYSDEAIKVKAQLKDLRAELKKHTDYLIAQVKVVFSTIANFVINPRLKDAEYDNLIVDEASMLAEPQLIALARKVKKRIILVGDFQQLAPITEAGVPILKENVFKLCNIDLEHSNHPALHQLLHQRRSNPKIVDLINHAFYADKLYAEEKPFNEVTAREPYNGCVIGMKCVKNGCVRFTKGGTRQNTYNSEAVMELLDILSKQADEDFKIGVITPYTGQVSLLKAKFYGKEYDVDFQQRVRIGTVHTFQGSECELIIFDMVDCSRFEKGNPYIGRIYAGEQGEQLLNVAISRAKYKLIVVCEPDFIANCPGDRISIKTQKIFNELLRFKNTRQ